MLMPRYLGGIGLTLTVGLSACWGFGPVGEGGGRGSDGEGREISVFDLTVGTCFDANDSDFETVDAVPCTAEHEYEVFLVTDYEGGSGDEYPGDDALDEFADQACEGTAFDRYVGSSYASSRYYATALIPSENTWEAGDREIVCMLYDPNDDALTDSARNSGE